MKSYELKGVDRYLDKVMKYIPEKINPEIISTGGGYYSIAVIIGEYTLEVSNEAGGIILYDSTGAAVMILSYENDPKKVAKELMNLYSMNLA